MKAAVLRRPIFLNSVKITMKTRIHVTSPKARKAAVSGL
jgi:hypothetical protein